MKIAIYPGCMVLARFQEYELASRRVLEQLGYEIVELGEFCCCGASLLPGVTDNWVNLAAYTLALAEKVGANIVTLCGNCTNNFKRVNLYLEGNPKVRDEIIERNMDMHIKKYPLLTEEIISAYRYVFDKKVCGNRVHTRDAEVVCGAAFFVLHKYRVK